VTLRSTQVATADRSIERVVDDFVADIVLIARRAAVAALQAGLPATPKRSRPRAADLPEPTRSRRNRLAGPKAGPQAAPSQAPSRDLTSRAGSPATAPMTPSASAPDARGGRSASATPHASLRVTPLFGDRSSKKRNSYEEVLLAFLADHPGSSIAEIASGARIHKAERIVSRLARQGRVGAQVRGATSFYFAMAPGHLMGTRLMPPARTTAR
jgi:hypothetical protein